MYINMFKENKCKICGLDNPEPKHFYSQHKIKEAGYYEKYYPRINLLTKEPIPFRDRESYFLNDFKTRDELKTWLLAQHIDIQQQYSIEIIKRRKELKDIRYAPSQIELSSLILPKIQYLDKIYSNMGGYYKVCEQMGLINKFQSINKGTLISINSFFHNNEDSFIYQDTREQSPLKLDYPIQAKALPYGDYALYDSANNNIFIDRKGLSDAISTLSGGFERFQREIERCETDGNHLVMLIEEKIHNLLNFKSLPWMSRKIKADEVFIMHRARQLCQKYKNFQIVCVDGRVEAARVIKKILFSNGMCAKIDLQLAYEIGIL